MSDNTSIPEEQPPVDDSVRLAEWLTRMIILINGIFREIFYRLDTVETVLLTGEESGDQAPAESDVGLQVKFGPGGTSPDGSVSITPSGTVLFNHAITINVTLVFHYIRSSNNNQCYMIFSSTFNDEIAGNSIIRNISRSFEPEGFEVTYTVSGKPKDEWKIYFTRDSQGVADGYLHTFTPTNSNFPPGYGASIRISRNI